MKGKMFESEYEEAFVELLQNEEWQYTYGGEMHRQYTNVIIEEDMRNFIKMNYSDKGLTDDDFDVIIARMRNVGEATDYTSLCAAYYKKNFKINF